MPKSKFRIVELGGGCGHLARTLKLFMPNSVYVAIDLPETLHFAYIFLNLNFPHARTFYVTDPSQLKDGIQEFDFVFVPTMFAESILEDEFDLFCNTASLGEMSNPVIRYWMDFIQNRLKLKYFFGLNRFLNRFSLPLQWRLNENECSVLFNANWRILDWELEPPFARCPYEETIVPRSLEIIAERLPNASVNESDSQVLSQQIIKDLMDEDWIRLPNRYIHSPMGGNMLANDLTMSGTLYKLWESIRLNPNKTNVAMMIIYLHTLMKRDYSSIIYPFEEWFYYKNLLKSFISRDTALPSKTNLAEPEYEYLWKRALTLSISYNPFSIKAWGYYIIGFTPAFMRPALFKFCEVTYHKLNPIPYLRKIKRRLVTRLSRT